MKLRRTIPVETPPVPQVTAPPPKTVLAKPTELIASALIFLLLTIGIVALTRPSDEVPLPGRALQPNQLDADRHLVWVRLDSVQNRLAQLPDGLSVRVNNDRLFIRNDDRKQLERYLFNSLDMSQFTKAKDSPVRLEADGNGFSLPIQRRQTIDYVQVPTDLISSLLRSTESTAE